MTDDEYRMACMFYDWYGIRGLVLTPHQWHLFVGRRALERLRSKRA